jgi:hypothetical protein
MYKLGKKSLKNLVGVHPILGFAVQEAIKITKQDFTVLEGVRTVERQAQLVKDGASKTLDSYHLYGLAVDLVAIVDGKPSWSEKLYPEIARAMKEVIKKHGLPIEWGFDKWKWDMPHWQMTGYKKEYDIRTI